MRAPVGSRTVPDKVAFVLCAQTDPATNRNRTPHHLFISYSSTYVADSIKRKPPHRFVLEFAPPCHPQKSGGKDDEFKNIGSGGVCVDLQPKSARFFDGPSSESKWSVGCLLYCLPQDIRFEFGSGKRPNSGTPVGVVAGRDLHAASRC